tara:strand:+ start:254 stop:517 length:264 start_codon:yes stop_codon:yes gene_type:complete
MSEFESLKTKLEQLDFPNVYYFKFIVPNKESLINSVKDLFLKESGIEMKASSSGKFISLSHKQVVLSADEIINIYKQASKIEGIISL